MICSVAFLRKLKLAFIKLRRGRARFRSSLPRCRWTCILKAAAHETEQAYAHPSADGRNEAQPCTALSKASTGGACLPSEAKAYTVPQASSRQADRHMAAKWSSVAKRARPRAPGPAGAAPSTAPVGSSVHAPPGASAPRSASTTRREAGSVQQLRTWAGWPAACGSLWLEAHTQQHPFVCQEVVCATEATIVGTLGLLREIELASLTVGDVQVVDGVGCGVATIFIAASKRDTRAVGCKRALGCRCPEATCPVRAARTLSARARNWCRDPRARLVRTPGGSGVSMQAMVQALQA